MYLDTFQARLLATGLPVVPCPARLQIAFENMMKALTRPSKPAAPPTIRRAFTKEIQNRGRNGGLNPRGREAGVLVQGAPRQTRVCAGPDENLPNTRFKRRSTFEAGPASRAPDRRGAAEISIAAVDTRPASPLLLYSCRESESASEFSGESLTSSAQVTHVTRFPCAGAIEPRMC